ncbi:hypothetical protein MUGA111182_13405 [Mucilaginibacter galii]
MKEKNVENTYFINIFNKGTFYYYYCKNMR